MLIKPQPRKRKRYRAKITWETQEQLALIFVILCLGAIMILIEYAKYKGI